MTFKNSKFHDNSAYNGGVIYAAAALTLKIDNCIFENNMAN